MTIFHLVQKATWVYNEEDFNSVVEVLASKGVENISTHQYFHKAYWNKRIRRGTPPASIHGDNVKKL